MNNKSFIVAALSAFVQYYDYHLFGFLAATISKYFFQHTTQEKQLLNTYLIILVAMAAKPIGAIILGRIGDLYGRSNSFNISIIGTAIASLIIGITPGYEYIGLISSVALLLCRMVVCGLVSSGSDGVRIYVYEHVGKKSQCTAIALTSVCMQLGSLVAASSALFFTLDFMPNYNWRLAFLLGSSMGLGVVFLKYKWGVKDVAKTSSQLRFDEFKVLPTPAVIRSHFKIFLPSLVISGCIGSFHQFFIIFFGTYNFAVLQSIDRSEMQVYVIIAIAIYILFSIVAGFVADKLGRHKPVNLAIFLILFIAACHIYTLSSGKPNAFVFLSTTLVLPFITIPLAAIIKESIPTVVRYRVFSLAHALGSICISAPTAYISTLLYHKTHIPWFPLLYFVVTVISTFVAFRFLENLSVRKEKK